MFYNLFINPHREYQNNPFLWGYCVGKNDQGVTLFANDALDIYNRVIVSEKSVFLEDLSTRLDEKLAKGYLPIFSFNDSYDNVPPNGNHDFRLNLTIVGSFIQYACEEFSDQSAVDLSLLCEEFVDINYSFLKSYVSKDGKQIEYFKNIDQCRDEINSIKVGLILGINQFCHEQYGFAQFDNTVAPKEFDFVFKKGVLCPIW
jgi:hypothetical protein